MCSTFKCILVGDGEVGKTTLIKRLLSDVDVEKYYPTLGVNVHPITFNTTRGPIRFNVWDVAGQPCYRGLGDGYYIQAQCAIVMFDLNNQESIDQAKEHAAHITHLLGNIPIIKVGNKYDLLTSESVSYKRRKVCDCEMSIKHDQQIDTPFLHLTRSLLRDPNLLFINP
jgi:GTP-binding nuclear protein Ran